MIVLAGGFDDAKETKVVTMLGVEAPEDLRCSHEEPDTCMIFHAVNVNRKFQSAGIVGRIILKSPDTDVLVLCIHYFPTLTNISQLWFETGTGTNAVNQHRYIPVHEISKSLSNPLSQSLPAAHALTGCDTTSYFFWIGKKSVFKLLEVNPDL